MLTSASNAQIKNIQLLMDKNKARREQGLFVAEGIKMFLEAPVRMVEKIYVSESFFAKTIHAGKIEKLPYEVVADDIFKKISDTKTPQGIMTVLKQPHYTEEDFFQNENGLYLILNGIQDPGNLGTMIRTGEGAGVSGIIMDRNTVDVFSPKVIRATMGSIYRVPVLSTSYLTETIQKMKQAGIKTYAAHLEGRNSYTGENYQGGTAFMIGNEGNGLEDEVAALADTRIRIPMQGKVESLNAAISAALLMYEANRQRQEKH